MPPGDGRRLWAVGDTHALKATAEDTAGGSLFVMEVSVPPGGGPPPHVRRRMDEAFSVLEEDLEFLEGERSLVAGAGSFVLIPRGVVHLFNNVGTRTARALFVVAPAGFEGFLEEVGRSAGEAAAPPTSPEEIEKAIAAAPKDDTEIFPPQT